MNNVEGVIKVLDGQTVRVDLTVTWSNGHKPKRMVIGRLEVKQNKFSVEELAGQGYLLVILPFHQVTHIRIDPDSGASWCAVIEAVDRPEDDYD